MYHLKRGGECCGCSVGDGDGDAAAAADDDDDEKKEKANEIQSGCEKKNIKVMN